MKPAVVIPFMGKDPDRVLNLQHVQRYYQRHFEIFMGSGETIGEARNDGAFKAIAKGHDLLFFVDADIIIPIDNITLGTKIAALSGSAVYPYGKIVRTEFAERNDFLQRGALPGRTDGAPEGGALILSRQGFVQACGFPKLSWGEDNIFHNAVRSLVGPITRVWETGYHLWHPESQNTCFDSAVMQVVRLTEQAIPNPEMMRRIILKAGYHDVARFSAAGYEP